MGKKGIILVISMIVMAVLFTVTGAYFSGLITETRSANTEKFVLQSLALAEAGASHGLQELKKRAGADLTAAIEVALRTTTANNLAQFFAQQNPLGLLTTYGQFSVASGLAAFSPGLSPLSLQSGVQGTYSVSVTVIPDPAFSQNPSNPASDEYVFYYKYSLEANAQVTKTVPNTTRKVGLSEGKFSINVHRDNYAKYALFTSHHNTPSGTTVWFTENTNFTGPVHTNTRFNFANNPSGHFTEKITQHQQKAGFYHSPLLLDADSYPPFDVPIFDKGFGRSYEEINLPSSVSQTDLKNQAQGGSPEPGQNGIYVPNDGANVTGGIYIKGNQGQSSDDAIVTMSSTADGPVYTITQSSVTKTVSINYTNNQTKVQTGLQIDTYQGIPDGVSNEGVLIYSNDSISSLSGQVQEDALVTVSSERDVVITNSIAYEKDPRIPGNENYANLLGVIAWGGNVRIGTTAPSNININGIMMAPHGVFTVDNYQTRPPSGAANLLGGAITDFYGPFGTFSGTTQVSGYGRNFVYDTRMLQGSAPPYFPYMKNYTSGTSPTDAFLYKKLIWQDKGTQT